MITGLQQSHASGQHGRHAGGRCHTPLAPLQGGKPLFEHPHRWIGKARIDIAGLLAGEASRRLGGAGEREAGRGKYGLRLLTLVGGEVADVDGLGIEARSLVI